MNITVFLACRNYIKAFFALNLKVMMWNKHSSKYLSLFITVEVQPGVGAGGGAGAGGLGTTDTIS